MYACLQTNIFFQTSNNHNESSDATDSKSIKPSYGGFSLTTESKSEKSGYIASFPLTSDRADRTDGRSDRSSDPRTVRAYPKSKVHPVDGFYRYDDNFYFHYMAKVSPNSCSEIC